MKKLCLNVVLVLMLSMIGRNAFAMEEFCWAVGMVYPTTGYTITSEQEIYVEYNYARTQGRYRITFYVPGWYTFTYSAENYEPYEGYMVITDNQGGIEMDFRSVYLQPLVSSISELTIVNRESHLLLKVEGILRKEDEIN